MSQPDLIHGSEMPPDLRAKLGHIDVEIDRGYLDYSAKAAAPSPDYVPDCFDSRWFVASRQLDCFRTRYAKKTSAHRHLLIVR